jgi:hypothetical protein
MPVPSLVIAPMATDPDRLSASSASFWGSADEPSFIRFDRPEDNPHGAGALGRGQNFVVEYCELERGSTLSRDQEIDEYLVIVLDEGRGLAIDAADGRTVAVGVAVGIVPAGPTELSALDDVRIVSVFTSRHGDLAGKATNADAYREPNPRVAPLLPVAEGHPPVQVHRLADHPEDPRRFGRAFRSRDILVNFINPRIGPRDPSSLSPHVHDDFEQGSLVIAGEYVHHIRRPWTSDISDWRPDRHLECAGPSLFVIPPGQVHTSQAMGAGENLLIDIFAPPRLDLVGRPGFVLNQAIYEPGSDHSPAS